MWRTWERLLMVSIYSPLDNFPRTISPNKILQDNYPQEFLPGQLLPTKFPPMNLPPLSFCSPYIFSWLIPPCTTTPGQLPLMKFILGQVAMDVCPRQLPLSNLWIAFKTSTVYTSNKIRKKLSEGLCMPHRGNILFRWNLIYKYMELGFILT